MQIAKVLAREAAQLVTRSPQTAAQIFVRAPPAAQRLVLEVGREGERARNRPPSMRPLNLGLLEKQVKPWRGG